MNIYEIEDTLVLALEGEFDAAVVQAKRSEIEALAQTTSQRVAVDLSHVTFMDSSGIGVVVFLYKRLRARGLDMAIVGANGEPERLMQLLRIDRTIPNYPSTDAFLATVRRQHGLTLQVVN